MQLNGCGGAMQKLQFQIMTAKTSSNTQVGNTFLIAISCQSGSFGLTLIDQTQCLAVVALDPKAGRFFSITTVTTRSDSNTCHFNLPWKLPAAIVVAKMPGGCVLQKQIALSIVLSFMACSEGVCWNGQLGRVIRGRCTIHSRKKWQYAQLSMDAKVNHMLSSEWTQNS